MKIIFIRHGESEANVRQIISNTGYVHGLTEKGKTQADTIAKKLKNKYSDSVKIISSPLKRANETANIISNHFNTNYSIDNRIVEFHTGILEGKSDIDSWNQLTDLWKLWLSGEAHSVAIPEGECLDDVVIRVGDFLNSIIKEYGESDIILCISHGGVLQTALPYVLKDNKAEELKSYYLQNTDIVEIEYLNNGFSCNKYGSID